LLPEPLLVCELAARRRDGGRFSPERSADELGLLDDASIVGLDESVPKLAIVGVSVTSLVVSMVGSFDGDLVGREEGISIGTGVGPLLVGSGATDGSGVGEVGGVLDGSLDDRWVGAGLGFAEDSNAVGEEEGAEEGSRPFVGAPEGRKVILRVGASDGTIVLDCASGAKPDSVAFSASRMDGIELSAWDRLGAALKPSVGMLVGIRLGCGVGSAVGVAECRTVGGKVAMVGLLVGLMDSDSEGIPVDGSSLGDLVGLVDGAMFENRVGWLVGFQLGMIVGPVVGECVGWIDGLWVGWIDGALVGWMDGFWVGEMDGCIVGALLGLLVGKLVGLSVGATVVGRLDGPFVGDGVPSRSRS
jgi:hypothetical protein